MNPITGIAMINNKKTTSISCLRSQRTVIRDGNESSSAADHWRPSVKRIGCTTSAMDLRSLDSFDPGSSGGITHLGDDPARGLREINGERCTEFRPGRKPPEKRQDDRKGVCHEGSRNQVDNPAGIGR
jgi:hypothetical protein